MESQKNKIQEHHGQCLVATSLPFEQARDLLFSLLAKEIKSSGSIGETQINDNRLDFRATGRIRKRPNFSNFRNLEAASFQVGSGEGGLSVQYSLDYGKFKWLYPMLILLIVGAVAWYFSRDIIFSGLMGAFFATAYFYEHWRIKRVFRRIPIYLNNLMVP